MFYAMAVSMAQAAEVLRRRVRQCRRRVRQCRHRLRFDLILDARQQARAAAGMGTAGQASAPGVAVDEAREACAQPTQSCGAC